MGMSNYKQVRVTLTEQRDTCHPGAVRVGIRVCVKPLNEEWNVKHCVLSADQHALPSIATMDGVYAALLEFLATDPLPGHIG